MPTGLTSPAHLLVVIVVALIVLGPEKMPQAVRQVGRAVAELRRWSETMSSEVHGALSLDAEPDPAPGPGASPPVSSPEGGEHI